MHRTTATAATLAASLLLTLAACGSGTSAGGKPAVAASSSSSPATFTASGHLSLHDSDFVHLDATQTAVTDCSGGGQGGYSDIQGGTQVVVTDPTSKIVAVGSLGEPVTGDLLGTCEFPWTVPGVPAGLATYGVEVSHRGSLQETEADLRAGTVTFTLG